jgi:Rha family phage regulatory protein
MWFAEVVTPQSTEEIAVQNEIALVQQNNQAFVSSRELALKFGKQHKDVLRIIHGHLDSEKMNDFNQRNFSRNEHVQVGCAKRGRPRLAAVLMTRDGFALLAMGFTGKRALEWKVKFLEAFNEMERVLLDEIPRLQARIIELEANLTRKALPGRRANQIAVPVYHENLFGLVEEIRYEMRNKEKLDELMQAKAVVRHLRKQMKGMIAKQDQLAERIDLLEGNKKAKLIKLIKDDPEKPL